MKGLNIVGKELLGNAWKEIGNIHRQVGDKVLGIIPAIKERLKADSFKDEDIELLLSSKGAILEVSLGELKNEDYDKERQTAVGNFLKNLAVLVESL